ncbi:MAG: peptide-modifying radical SAM enzyme CbpB [Omnitrophica bacterium]|nr:peptide-modifying radical SAM enzyme CbpB [Candidatus Omnitrophota bacterium]
MDIKHRDYVGIVSGDAAFWALVKSGQLDKVFTDPACLREYRKKRKTFIDEIKKLRFGLIPSAVYFNPTDRCNLNCSYCYIPEKIRKNGRDMSARKLEEALSILKNYFKTTLPKGQKPEIVFHGAEPMLNQKNVFGVIEKFRDDFRFGIQTNGTLFDKEALSFLTSRGINIGLSLDGHIPRVADGMRKTWGGEGVSKKVVEIIKLLKGYDNFSVICTVTKSNMRSLKKITAYLHDLGVSNCLLNPVRCTLQKARESKPKDHEMSKYYLEALDHTYELYRKTGRKLVIANFANILISIMAPAARRLMCDISPCGGGRCFFAVSANGDLFPCSEFIGIKKFKGGNLFKDNIADVLKSRSFALVTDRKIESIRSCSQCAIRHFCGSPCPAEAHEMHGSMNKPGAFCELYEEQVRYALRLIADKKENAYLWNDWDKGMYTNLEITELNA